MIFNLVSLMPFLKLLFDHIRKYKEKSWLGGEKSFPSPRITSELSIMWTRSFSLSSYLKLSSLFTNKDHNHEFGGQISLPPRFLTLRLLYQPSRKEKKTSSIPVFKAEHQRWYTQTYKEIYFSISGNPLQNNFENPNIAMDNLTPKGFMNPIVATSILFGFYPWIWRSWIYLEYILCVNMKLQKKFTIGNSAQVFLKGSDQCKNNMDRLEK